MLHLKLFPINFFQLYTIHCEKDGDIVPCMHGLMPNKLQFTYDELLKKLKGIEPEIDSSSIMIDLENFIAVLSGYRVVLVH